MANKREIKKYVNALGASICESMMSAYYNIKGVNKDAIEQAMGKVLGAIGAAKAHANLFFDKKEKDFADKKEYLAEKRAFFKALFAKIVNDYNEEIDAAMKQFNAAIPAEIKQQNKASVAEK
ncbi:MAG: hypothetical protein HDS73_04580 [Bacteroidales bacterium]|nr:hypothetical protein [Bacteroidales bacterium]